MNKINKIQRLYQEYKEACSGLTYCIGRFFLSSGYGVTVSIFQETEIEIFLKIHKETEEEMTEVANNFRKLLPILCDEFNLEIVYSESLIYEKAELDPAINTFRCEKVILQGVKR